MLNQKSFRGNSNKLLLIINKRKFARILKYRMKINKVLHLTFVIILLIFCISGLITPPVALLLGIAFAFSFKNPVLKNNQKIYTVLLKLSIIGTGFGLSLDNALLIGSRGLVFTLFSVTATLILGLLVGKWLNIDKKLSHLITSGTAICGGTAVAALSPVIKADQKQTSISLSIIFILNGIGLIVFPEIGKFLHLTEKQFGFWAAIAIHDTSSVVGAASTFGKEALTTATTVKLGRTLWIIPFVILSSMMFKEKTTRIQIPYFIGFFLAAIVTNTFIPEIHQYAETIVACAKKGFTATLFLIGTGISKEILKDIGFKPFLQGILIWIVICVTTLIIILQI